jgi:5-methyltetrahydropteroyltriglutamate--homocysteine methyltransferase
MINTKIGMRSPVIPIVNASWQRWSAGCTEICVDEPSMSCYAWREDPARLVDIFN